MAQRRPSDNADVLDALDDVSWETLTHAYEPASDVLRLMQMAAGVVDPTIAADELRVRA